MKKTLLILFAAVAMTVAGAVAAYAGPAAPAVPSPKPAGTANQSTTDEAQVGTQETGIAGQSTKDMDKSSWLSLPTGVCAKLAGGSTTKM